MGEVHQAGCQSLSTSRSETLSGKCPSCPSQWQWCSTVSLFSDSGGFFFVMEFHCETQADIKHIVPQPLELKAYNVMHSFSIVGFCLFFLLKLHLLICVCAIIQYEGQRTTWGIGSSFPSWGSQRSNSGYQCWQQVPQPSELSGQSRPNQDFWLIYYRLTRILLLFEPYKSWSLSSREASCSRSCQVRSTRVQPFCCGVDTT